MDPQSAPSSQRRQFLYIILGTTAAFVTGLAAWPVWHYLLPGRKADAEAKIPVPRGNVPLGKGYFFNFRGQPAVILQPAPGRFVALSAVCTHLGCVVQWLPDKKEFLCPCHGGRFNAEGQVLGGPPPKPLALLPLTLEGDQLLVG